jgi:hypothetical protein
VPVRIVGRLPESVDRTVREVLHKALDQRRQLFVVHISWPHTELIVEIKQPFGRRLKFNHLSEAEIARELYGTIMSIADENCGADLRELTGD